MTGLIHILMLAGFLAPGGSGIAAWVKYAPQAPFPPRPIAEQIDLVLIDKSDRRMTLFSDGRPVKSYPVALGYAPRRAKMQEGDGRTPEGVYRIDRRNPKSAYHLSLGINYPLPEHRRLARAAGVSPGGDIFIHGQPNRRKGMPALAGDWTAGCVAITDEAIEELWRVIPTGTDVVIRP
ncbi:murein L,D-transpeptidase family protein [Tropicimonas sp. IMCC34043]|uniref:L,D-transpeptidase family protein n=1 Tax=Tropicimonas sp. IMCC34043 TaxID=2248760 RepID=UPI000E23F106|nr:L,D-transpeptidase family protein [Tropicimonas sp. IMCC34043]